MININLCNCQQFISVVIGQGPGVFRGTYYTTCRVSLQQVAKKLKNWYFFHVKFVYFS